MKGGGRGRGGRGRDVVNQILFLRSGTHAGTGTDTKERIVWSKVFLSYRARVRLLLPISIFSIGNCGFCICLRTDVYSTIQRKGAKTQRRGKNRRDRPFCGACSQGRKYFLRKQRNCRGFGLLTCFLKKYFLPWGVNFVHKRAIRVPSHFSFLPFASLR